MRKFRFLLAASASCIAMPATAADQLKFGPAPDWVVQRALPAVSAKADQSAPIQFVLSDQQTRVQAGRTLTFTMSAFKVQTPEGLQVGNVSLPWDPARQTITVHKLEIHRAGKVIDVLASQQFTTLRREQNLEAAMLDGVLTANLQPEGLEAGDTLLLAVTTEHSDPVMQGNVEIGFGNWNGIPITAAHSRISWPDKLKLNIRAAGGLPQDRSTSRNGEKVYEIAAVDVQPIIPPKDAPARFVVGRQGEATTFQSWSQVADLMRPLYQTASVVPKTGPLRDELEKIRGATSDPVQRAEKALDLVEHRVRYVALLMGQGGYVPASAETTWSRRFGDCKAKTALLLALLRELEIEAEPVLVKTVGADGLNERLPMAAHFNHVILRARIGGRTYWLDGTRQGDSKLETISTPKFHWGLPLTAGAELVRMLPPPLTVPDTDLNITIDATKGLFAPAPMVAELVERGDDARQANLYYSNMTVAQRDQMMRDFWKQEHKYASIESVQYSYDRDKAEVRLLMKGTAKLDWQDGWLYVVGSTLAYEPSFDRSPGPLQLAPVKVAYPMYRRTRFELRAPESFAAAMRTAKLAEPVDEKLAGFEYRRTMTVNGDRLIVETAERSLVPEISYEEARASEARLKTLNDSEINLRVPASYRYTDADHEVRRASTPTTAAGYADRGNAYLNSMEFDRAIADFDQAHRLDPKNAWVLAQRASARAMQRNFKAAELDVAAALALQPDLAPALHTQAMIAGMQGQHKKAVALLDVIIAKDPRNAPALRARTGSHFVLNDVAAAERDIAALAAIDSNDPSLGGLRAQLAFNKGDKKAGLAWLSALIKAAPQDAKLWLARANAHRDANQPAKALADVSRSLELDSENADARLLRINLRVAAGDTKGALEDADFMVASNPETTFPLVAAAKTYAAAALSEKAMQTINKALALKPESYIYVNRSQIRPRSDRQGRLADLEEALKLDPDDRDALYFKSRILWSNRDWEGTAALLSRLETLAPEQAEYYRVGRAVVLHKAGKIAEADKLFNQLEKSATTAEQFNNLCWDKATENIRLESALENCRAAERLSPDTPAYMDSLGMVLMRLGKLDEALAAYDRALAKTKFSAAFMGRALVHARRGDAKRAAADAAEARKIHASVDEEFEGYGLRLEDVLATN